MPNMSVRIDLAGWTVGIPCPVREEVRSPPPSLSLPPGYILKRVFTDFSRIVIVPAVGTLYANVHLYSDQLGTSEPRTNRTDRWARPENYVGKMAI